MNHETVEIIQEVLSERAKIYDMLRRIFLLGPSIELLDEFHSITRARSSKLESGQTLSRGEGLLKDFFDEKGSEDSLEFCHYLLVEYTRLFVGPHHLPAPPYESVYRSKNKLINIKKQHCTKTIFSAVLFLEKCIGKRGNI